jgi:hypothetical protein
MALAAQTGRTIGCSHSSAPYMMCHLLLAQPPTQLLLRSAARSLACLKSPLQFQQLGKHAHPWRENPVESLFSFAALDSLPREQRASGVPPTSADISDWHISGIACA